MEKDAITEYVGKKSWRVTENANAKWSFSGLQSFLSGKYLANHSLNKLYTKPISDAHNKCKIHIHDLDSGGKIAYCVGHSLKDLLLQGFGGVPGKITTKPAKHFNAALGQIVNYIGTLQNEFSGAQAFSSFDTYLAPFIRYDNLGPDQVKQSLQEFIFSINQSSRWGNQVPFFNITLDFKCPEPLKKQQIIIAGKTQKETYNDFQREMDLFNDALLDLYIEGDGEGRPFTFPLPTINLTKDFEWESKLSQKIFYMTGKYGTPTFQSFINSELDPSMTYSMCCRLRIDLKELEHKQGGLFGAAEKTGSIGVVTINLPQLGYKFKGNPEGFFKELENLINISAESLEMKRKEVEKSIKDGLVPYTKIYIGTMENHFSTIGINGMHECCQNFFDSSKIGITSDEGKEFALQILDFMREKLKQIQAKTKNMYNLEATPAEGTSFRLAKNDLEEFPDIITSGTKKVPFYTNSTHLPVDNNGDIFDAIQHQDELQCKYTGGCIEENSLVMTEKGLKPIKELIGVKNTKVYSFNEKTYETELKQVEDAQYVEVSEKDKLVIELEGDNDIITSVWHPFYIIDENLKVKSKRADELCIGDFVVSTKTGIKNCNETIGVNCAWLLGEFLTDGYFNNTQISFYSKNQKTQDKIKKILNTLIGDTYKIYKNGEEIRIYKKESRNKLYELIKLTPGPKTYTCKIREDFLTWNIQERLSLLCGIIDGDGNVPKSGKYIRICSASHTFSKNIIELIYSLGMSGTIMQRNNLNYIFITRNQYLKHLDVFKTGLTYENKSNRLQYSKTNGRQGIFCSKKIKHLGNYTYPTGKYRTKNKISFELAKQINPNLDGIGGFFVKNLSTPNINTKFCDLTVEGNNNYLAGNNGLVFIHNTIFHAYIGERIHDWRTTRNLVKKIAENTKMPYFTISPTFTICSNHGYISGEHKVCPLDECEGKTEIYSRIVGYYRPVEQWNNGKKQEFKERKTFKYE